MKEYERGDNGAKLRGDRGGDCWANSHRNLDSDNRRHYMQDIDAFMGSLSFATNGQDKVFAEYVPDHYKNRAETIRDFAVVALFDRKETRSGANRYKSDPMERISLGFYLWLCRTLAAQQPIPPQFFYVCGRSPSFEMVELDIESGDEKRVFIYQDDLADWRRVWQESGLIEARMKLKAWIEHGKEIAW